MYEVEVLDLEKNIEFKKIFNDKKEMQRFVRKVNYSKKLKLLMVVNNSYLYD